MNIWNTKRRISGVNTNEEHLQIMKRKGSKKYCFWPTPTFWHMLKFHWTHHLRQKFGIRKNFMNLHYPRQNFDPHHFCFINVTHETTTPTLSTSPTLFSRPESYNDDICWNNFRWRNISQPCKIFFVILFFLSDVKLMQSS